MTLAFGISAAGVDLVRDLVSASGCGFVGPEAGYRTGVIQYHQLLSAPSGASTLRELLDAADRAGFSDQFQAALDDGGRPWLCCTSCDHRARPEYVTVVWAARTEGASDPADELYVAAIELPGCQARGVFIAPYGPAASIADAALLRELPAPLSIAA